ncbi:MULTISPECIES: hypothetical protein [unclassified Arthrobacter]|uniref:hypothetical protein n=1 Tax=unclassified Arthrobacter TaxID=235627 RepID=UPI001F46C556|nr:hypothetical protein [Arthrobacter sp. FW306-06-A]UKA69895.1 hypothetical protein LFT49_14195 [Arthrobacter sp. FW306-06-A]
MTMVSNRSELSLSRTGIHGGLRRGTAAAAVGAVLVLSAGVQAALADDAVSTPQDPPVQASPVATADAGVAPRQEAMTVQRGSEGDGKMPAADAQRPTAPALPAVPGALRPAVTASLSTAIPTATARATAAASMTALPLPDLPLPIVSGTPLVTGGQASAPTATSSPAPSSPVPASPGSPTEAGPSAASVPGTAPAPGRSPASGTAPAVGAPVGAGAQAPAPVPPSGASGTDPLAVGQTGGAQASGTGTAGAAGMPGAAASGIAGSTAADASQASSDPVSASAPVLPTDLPTTLSINARQSLPTRAPQAAGEPAEPGRAVSSTGPLPDVPDAMVWLGAGLVGVGAAAGLVFLRMRRL